MDDLIRNRLKEIYNDEFGPDGDFSDLLFKYHSDDCFFECDRGIPVSLLFGFDAYMAKFNGKYCFAAVTDKKYRQKGHMTELLKNYISYCKKTDVDFLYLKPANEHLYNFYSKFGFKPFFYGYKEKVYNTGKRHNTVKISTFEQLRDCNIKFKDNTPIFTGKLYKSILNSYECITNDILNPSFVAYCDLSCKPASIEFIGDKSYISDVLTFIKSESANVFFSGGKEYAGMLLKLNEFDIEGDYNLGITME